MKSLMITTDYPPQPIGGIGRHVEDLTRALRRRGTDVTVLTLDQGHSAPFDNKVIRVQQSGPVIQEVPGESPLHLILQNNISMAAAGAKLLSKTNFDIIHCHDMFGACVANVLSSLNGIPWIMTFHWIEKNYSHENHSTDAITQWSHNYFISLQEWGLSTASRVIAVSNAVKEELRTINGNAVQWKCSVINNGTDIWSYPMKEPSDAVRRRFCHGEEYVMLLVGRLGWRKGSDVAIRALSLLSPLPLRLIFVGVGHKKSELLELATELQVEDKVTFAGYIEGQELADLYRCADIVLVPSRIEPFGITVAEALSLGKTVVASKTGGILEQIKDGYNGLLCEPGNAEDLAQKIKQTFEHPDISAHIAQHGREEAEKKYSWDRIAKCTLQEYELAIKNSRAWDIH